MRSENFNEEAMERKIKVNLEKGFTIAEIKIALREEIIAKQIRIFELERELHILDARKVELADQIDYMDEKHKDNG